MPDVRMSHPHHHHHPSSSYGHGPGPGYPPAAPPPGYHPSARANGPPPPMMMAAPPPGVPIGGPPDVLPPAPNGHGPSISPALRAGKEKMDSVLGQLATANENTWMLIGAVAEQMNDQDRALAAFESALRHNPSSIIALNAVATIARSQDNYDKAIEYFQRILHIKQDNGEVWGSMGHCLLMKDDLPKAYTAYQQALYHLPNPKQEPKLWYGIGILYDRYGSFEHAEEAFSSVLKMDPNFEKANEIYFRLGIIYKHMRKFPASLDCFRYILNNPPRPLSTWDIWFQMGHVYEQDRDYEAARDAYMRVLHTQPDHAKVLQQLGWLYHQTGAPFADQEKAVQYLTRSLETDGSDAQSWYLLGRAFMAGQRYNKAYEAYQQAVYRDGRNPTFWISIGVLYFQINQYRDALDAYSRAIRLNPYISEVWFNLGSLYESCNNQLTDAIDAYTRAADLDPTNEQIKARLSALSSASNGRAVGPAPPPVDVHPSQYNSAPGLQNPGSPGESPRGPPGTAPLNEVRLDGPAGARDLPPPPPGGDLARGHSPGPFRGGAAPPPLAHVDESRGSMARHAPLAPMEPGPDQRNNAHRLEQSTDVRRRSVGGSPRRQPDYAPGSYRDREREEWERARARQGFDPRGPSPRLPSDARTVPSPRPGDYYGRPGDGPGHAYDARGGHPAERFDPTRRPDDRYESEHAHGHGGSNGRHEIRPDDPRAPSPAPSAASKGSRRGKAESFGEKMASGKKSNGVERARTSPSRNPATSPTSSMRGTALPNRSIDENYDEGAADALMALHGDRTPMNGPTNSVSSVRNSPPGRVSPPQAAGAKRMDPPSPVSPQSSKKPRGDSPSRAVPSANKEKKTNTVIEVLNAPRVNSPLPVPKAETASGDKGKAEAAEVPAVVPVPGKEKEPEPVPAEDVPAPSSKEADKAVSPARAAAQSAEAAQAAAPAPAAETKGALESHNEPPNGVTPEAPAPVEPASEPVGDVTMNGTEGVKGNGVAAPAQTEKAAPAVDEDVKMAEPEKTEPTEVTGAAPEIKA